MTAILKKFINAVFLFIVLFLATTNVEDFVGGSNDECVYPDVFQCINNICKCVSHHRT
ncbi:hypothetical protein MtrunA17_Chr2g0306721 [Medicago truncatula]|uniref:Nodule-specific cysteine-rich peptide 320 n=1 Tax=Medicago truncatula TaxID=3880 RepID=A7KHF0_MEDTR|nr:nodule-specific cysteine-rich peptide 320 [Medicago truncatula]AES65880.1 transmembrane protein, putative [Medicago truncatula]RHN74125.1 hypothetical protein MtrunA17_Chr2g0306721 [Medicago truncatula]